MTTTPHSQPHSAPGEQVLFACEQVVVTNRRVVLKTSSYATSAIVSVKVQHAKNQPKSGPNSSLLAGITVTIFGIAFAVASTYIVRGFIPLVALFATIGAFIVVAGIMVIIASFAAASHNTTTPYAVQIRTVDGQRERITGLTRASAKSIADAISTATALP